MTIVYISAIVIQLGIIVFFIRRGRLQKKQLEAMKAAGDISTYEALRNLALQVNLKQLKLVIPESTTLVYGVIMDWNLNDSVMTLAAYITGAASLYLSSGEGINGGGKDPAVGEAAAAFVVSAQEFMGRAMPVSTTDLPSKECIRFYLLTSHGLYGAQEKMVHFEDASSPWLMLFEQGSAVISSIRHSQLSPVGNQ